MLQFIQQTKKKIHKRKKIDNFNSFVKATCVGCSDELSPVLVSLLSVSILHNSLYVHIFIIISYLYDMIHVRCIITSGDQQEVTGLFTLGNKNQYSLAFHTFITTSANVALNSRYQKSFYKMNNVLYQLGVKNFATVGIRSFSVSKANNKTYS